MGWNLTDIVPPNPQTDKYSTMYQRVMKDNASSDVGTTTENIGEYWNTVVNPTNDPPFNEDEFESEYTGIFTEDISNYKKSQSGSPLSYDESAVTWGQQGLVRGGMNRDFVSETEQDYETFAQNVGIDKDTAPSPAAILDDIFTPWNLNAGGVANIAPDDLTGAFNDAQIETLKADAIAYPSETGAALAWSQKQEDLTIDETDTADDALDTLENTMEDLDRQQQDQQRQFINDLRAGRSGGGITGVRTGRNFRRTAPAVQNISLQRERARQEYDQAIDKSIDTTDREGGRSDITFTNTIGSAFSDLKNDLVNRVNTFKSDDIAEESDNAGAIVDQLDAGAGSPAPWPGGDPCPPGQHWDEEGGTSAGACVED